MAERQGTLEKMVIDRAAWQGRAVFLTGHTGFKGGWLSLGLAWLGAKVTGFALAPATDPSLFTAAQITRDLTTSLDGDIRDAGALSAALNAAQPEIVYHLAAQPLVRASYRDPAETWSTNVMGTVHLLEAVRQCPSVKAVIVVTTDKCYENREWHWGYREIDPLGGHDPYSASKAGAELVAASYRRSFLDKQGVLLATARAGNVIGGGDWSEDRLIPDAARAVQKGEALLIRNPAATRPWQHVLESLHGYLLLGQALLAGKREAAEAFNFGPEAMDNRSVTAVLEGLRTEWQELSWTIDPAYAEAPHEAQALYLDSAKARAVLGWQPRWRLETALTETAHWYRQALAEPTKTRALCLQQWERFGL